MGFREIFFGKYVKEIPVLTDTDEDSKLVHRRKRPKVDTLFSSFFRRVRARSMTQRRVENTRVHFWTFSAVSVNTFWRIIVLQNLNRQMQSGDRRMHQFFLNIFTKFGWLMKKTLVGNALHLKCHLNWQSFLPMKKKIG